MFSSCLPFQKTSSQTEAVSLDPFESLSREEVLEQFSDLSCAPFNSNENNVQSLSIQSSGPVQDISNGLEMEVRVSDLSRLGYSSAWSIHLDDFLDQNKADLLEAPVFSYNIDVPTVAFSQGFPTVEGDRLRDLEGNIVVEYFHISYFSQFKLPEDLTSGSYEFAVIGDDGYRMTLNDSLVLEYTGVTPSRLTCSGPVELTAGQYNEFFFEYFQGPRFHISSVLLYRSASTQDEPLCGAAGNNFWFTGHSQEFQTPTSNYNALLSRGWQVVPPSAFFLDSSSSFSSQSFSTQSIEGANPCSSDYVKGILSE